MFYKAIVIALIVSSVALAPISAWSQTGGNYEVTGSVIAAGIVSASDGGFEMDGTLGQSIAGDPVFADSFYVTSGFWTFEPTGPTAAPVSISGRVGTSMGRGIKGAILTLQKPNGEILVAHTSTFGNFRFEGIEAGTSVIIFVSAKGYRFSPRFVTLVSDYSGFDFVAQP